MSLHSDGGGMDDHLSPKRTAMRFPVWLKFALVLCGLATGNAGYLAFDSVMRFRIVEAIQAWMPQERSHGFVERAYLDAEGTTHRYMVFVPHSIREDEQLPLMVYLNGHGENGVNPFAPLKNGLAHAVWEDECNFPFVVVWPLCAEGDSWTRPGRSTERAISIMHAVARQYHTDPDRVYLTGISSGGTGTWAVAARYPKLFAAIVPVSAVVDDQAARQVAAAKIPVWGYAVQEDNSDLLKSNRAAHRRLLEAGVSSHLTEVTTRGNTAKDAHDAWSFAYRDGGMYRWLAAQSRSLRQHQLSTFELVDLSKVSDAENLTETADPIYGAIAKIPSGGPRALFSLISDRSEQAVEEVHLEFRCRNRVTRFGIGLLTNQGGGTPQGAAVELSIDDLSSGGLYSWPDRDCLATAVPVAERAFVNDGWNDLRCKFESGRTLVELNGWTWVDTDRIEMRRSRSVLGFVAEGEATAHVELRNLRILRDNLASAANGNRVLGNTPSVDIRENAFRLSGDGHRSVTREAVFEGWRRCEMSHANARLAWNMEPGFRFGAATLRTVVPSAAESSVHGPVCRMMLADGEVRYSSPWQHARIDLTRKFGLRDATTLRDYQRVLKANFERTAETLPAELRFDVVSDQARRVDWVSDRDGNGLRGIVYAKPDVWRDRVGEVDDLLWRGPLLAFLPLAKNGIGCRPEESVLLPGLAWCGGARCVVIEEVTHSEGSTFRRRFWADPLRDFLILKSTVDVDGTLREQVDVQYTRHDDGRWWPRSWEVMAWPKLSNAISELPFAGNEWLFHAAQANVIDEALSDDADLTLATGRLPLGTVGFDQKHNEWFEQLANDQRRRLPPDEVMAMTSADVTWTRESSSSLWIGGGLMMLTASWLLLRQWRKRGSRV